MEVKRLKILKSTVQESKQEIKPPKKNFFLFVILLVVGLIIGYIGLGINSFLSIILLLVSWACVIASFMQAIGVSECVCPNCETKGYIFKYSKKYKCKMCETTSVVIMEDVSSKE